MPNTPTTPLRIAVLASGRGSNLQALIEAQQSGRLPIEIVGVFGDKRAAHAFEYARSADIPTLAFAARDHYDRLAFDEALFAAVEEVQPALIVLAGYMRIISDEVVARFAGRMINIHPSLLPSYQGLHTHERVLRAGDRTHGASVHFVTPELDGGPVLAQVRIAVRDGDTPESLARRLLPLEHRLLLASVGLIAHRDVVATPFGVALDGELLAEPLVMRADDTLRDDRDQIR